MSPTAPQAYPALVPETLDLTEVVPPSRQEYATWVVSAVVRARCWDRAADDLTYVPLDSRYINRHIPQTARRPILDALLAAGVLDCDGEFWAGGDGVPGKCLYYRLGTACRGARLHVRPLRHPELLRKVARVRRDEADQLADPTHRALQQWHDRVEVLPTAQWGEHAFLDLMLSGERRFTVCPQGRVHHNVANLPAQCRQHIRLNGMGLESCDICTSQPLLLALLLTGRARVEEGRGGTGGGAENPLAFLDTYSDISVNDFLADCLAGHVYDQVAGLTGYSRDDVKPMFLAVVYGRPAHMTTRVGTAIRVLYPGVFEAVRRLNLALGRGGLPRLMQRIESGVMIDRVAGRLVREHPDMPLLTVHDSVLTPREYVGVVERVIAEEWTAAFGLAPRTKTSAFTAPQPARVRRRERRPPSGRRPRQKELASVQRMAV